MDRSECPRGSKCVGRDCPDCANFSPPPAEQASGEVEAIVATIRDQFAFTPEAAFTNEALKRLAALAQRPVVDEAMVERLASALAMHDQHRTTLQSLASSVGDFLRDYRALAGQKPTTGDR